ncbi:hypothetical protein G6F46_009217 [Rhizopus delemar]|uniref:Reverse transcriptase domain-containing protein n=2 Tax=Rhizopus TaxID=4842 RepID=A0A9P6YXD6_9FUNG|nr:hypothetical protein G6F55_008123 [Rhizopus delemar]KAG1539143.1 hypothetical protein G6F51_009322 [Rhizopus arrhizus]KAG1494078.1 hypothetical protein G6F54_008130 [Rhizopus delemar]KAG1512466.1 hypothetical protein G6F53_005167 [Rhizopus delemar]KAG1522657.1 hypothetical protein G6F52_005678 [Rhizopus delemar]
MYTPASTGKDRRKSFDSVLDAFTSVSDIDPRRIIIVDDYNYSYHRLNLSAQASLKWVTYLEESFYNVMHSGDNSNIPTFRRNDEIYSTIDYIFISQTLTGFSLWCANPILAQQKEYRIELKQRLTGIVSSLSSQMTAQEQWGYVKPEMRLLTQRYAIDYTNWRKKQLRSYSANCLPVTDQQIESLQQELVDIVALNREILWRELGEKSASYLKRIHQVQTTEQSINFLQDSTSGLTVFSRTQFMEVSQAFYQELYSVEPVDEHDIDCYLQDIADLPQLNENDRHYLISPITIENTIEQSEKVIGRQGSPGLGGLGYVFMHLIYQFSPLKDLIIKIYNMTLTAGSFPSSWQDLRVRLLPKKGDLSTLKNWRSIFLINCDAKIYTRIINQRMRSVMETSINRYQTGFLGDRFIAENGMVLNIFMEQAHVQRRPEIGLLLDQEKAYDRVHPMYLRQVMLAFGFPPSLVHSL